MLCVSVFACSLGFILKLFGVVLSVGYCEVRFLCMYGFACIGCHEVIHGAILMYLYHWTDHYGKSGQKPGNETNLLRIRFCLPVVLRTEAQEE